MASSLAAASGTFALGGDLPITRLGYGAMQLTGPGVWGPPVDPDEAIRVLRRTVDLGVNFIDTADSYGPFVSEQLIHKALYPYPPDLVIATKAGLSRQGPDRWSAIGRPEYLRQQAELSLRHLGVDCIDLFQLHRKDRWVPLAESLGALTELQREGKIRHIGLSEVSIRRLRRAQKAAMIVSVQNLYNVADRSAEPVVDYCEANGIAFIPYFPLGAGQLARADAWQTIAERLGASPSQLALAWLLRRSPVILPIPGTSKVAHLEENLRAAEIELTEGDVAAIAAATR
jgi:aryl-alcohol dehydrogenase-like predicted oxidoreductase